MKGEIPYPENICAKIGKFGIFKKKGLQRLFCAHIWGEKR